MSDLVRNPEDQFSCVAAQINISSLVLYCIKVNFDPNNAEETQSWP